MLSTDEPPFCATVNGERGSRCVCSLGVFWSWSLASPRRGRWSAAGPPGWRLVRPDQRSFPEIPCVWGCPKRGMTPLVTL